MHHDDTPPTPDEPGARPVAPDQVHPEVRPGPALRATFAYLLELGRRRRERLAAQAPEGDQ